MRGRLAIASALAVATVLGLGGTAEASGKERQVVASFTDAYAFSVDCAEFGPYGFENEVEGTMRARVTEVLASDGTLLQTVLHIQFRETDTNSLTGASLPLRGALHEVWDHVAGTRTIDGAVFVGTSPGGGTYVHDTGRITMTLDTSTPEFVAGPHEAFFAGGVDRVVCAALNREPA